MELLIQGKNAFDKIIQCIDEAQQSIEIKMFIWRDDEIGSRVLKHLMNAANRGVGITIIKDYYGVIFEKSEENKQSLFHKEKHRRLDFVSRILSMLYHPYEKGLLPQRDNKILNDFLKFEHVTFETGLYKDHTKYFIFDSQKLILGGINVEDKEVTKDLLGRIYQDYMVYVDDQQIVSRLNMRLINQEAHQKGRMIDFLIKNTYQNDVETFISYIHDAKESILMDMAYFGYAPVTKALKAASLRGVKIEIVTSRHANVQPHYNLKILKAYAKFGANIYLHDGLIHAKVILIDQKVLMLGSFNLNKPSMKKLSECQMVLKDEYVIKAWQNHHEALKKAATKYDVHQIKYSRFNAFLEKLFTS